MIAIARRLLCLTLPTTSLMTDLPDAPLIIIGAGLSGIGTAIQLHRLQSFTTYEIYEKAASLGGTWWHNTYRIHLRSPPPQC